MGPPTPEFYTLSLHDALPISQTTEVDPHARLVGDDLHQNRVAVRTSQDESGTAVDMDGADCLRRAAGDRKSTRLNSSHGYISYAVFCLKKKKTATVRHHARPE